MTGITLAVVVFLATLAAFLLRRRWRPVAVYSKYSDIVSVLHPPHTPLVQLLSARAHPNARLARVFGLGNTFVSADTTVHKQFVARAKEVLRAHTQHFAAFPDAARGIVAGVASRIPSSSSSSHRKSKSAMPFSRFAQLVTLRLVVCSLLRGNIPEDADEDVAFVVEAINDLWALSKSRKHAATTAATPTQAGLLERVNAHLSRWLPKYGQRPLDLVIPAYETMWRVVAVAVARAAHDRGARAAFSAYLDSPLERQYKCFDDNDDDDGGRPSVEAFICEVLRLHPPSRRLARARPPRFAAAAAAAAGFFLPLWTRALDVDIADLEALHRDVTIWGRDGNVFDPMRFHPSRLSHEQRRAFLPFGYGPLQCVAFKEAPRFAAIISASILEVVCEQGGRYRLVCGETLGRRDGWEGWSVAIDTMIYDS